MKNKKIGLGELFYNDKFILIFSVILAFILWVAVSMSANGPETTLEISNIPVKLELSQNAKDKGLMVYYPDGEKTASVTVKGNSLVLSQLNSNDISIVAPQADTILEKGNYNLDLVAKSVSNFTGYTIEQDSLSIKSTEILVDRATTKDYEIQSNINYKLDSQYFAFSETFTPNIVKISGPESIAKNVSSVRVDYNLNKTLKESQTFSAAVTLYDIDGNRISDVYKDLLNISSTETKVNLMVLKKANLPVKATFSNQPSGFDYGSMVKIENSNIDIACDEKLLSDIKEINLEPIDFRKITPTNTEFEQNIILPAGCKNLNEQSKVKVSMNLGEISSKTLKLNNINIINIPEDLKASLITKTITVTVVGSKEQISTITQSDVFTNVDLKDKENFVGSTEVSVDFSIANHPMCWVIGEHNVNVNIKK